MKEKDESYLLEDSLKDLIRTEKQPNKGDFHATLYQNLRKEKFYVKTNAYTDDAAIFNNKKYVENYFLVLEYLGSLFYSQLCYNCVVAEIKFIKNDFILEETPITNDSPLAASDYLSSYEIIEDNSLYYDSSSDDGSLIFIEGRDEPIEHIENKESKFFIASKWIENYISYFDASSLPYIEYSSVKLQYNEAIYQVSGYISILVTARFIEDSDAIGLGHNAGFIITSEEAKLAQTVKIDPGKSFSFLSLSGTVFSTAAHFINLVKEHEICFSTFLPLDYIDPYNPRQIISGLSKINIFMQLYYPDFDARDLLIGQMKYADIRKSDSLYLEFCQTLNKISALSEKEILQLVYSETPDSLNFGFQEIIAIKLKERQETLKRIYAVDLKFYQLYQQNPSINFNQLYKIAEQQTKISVPDPGFILDEKELELIDTKFFELLSPHIMEIPDLQKKLEARAALTEDAYEFISILEFKNTRFIKILLENSELLRTSLKYLHEWTSEDLSLKRNKAYINPLLEKETKINDPELTSILIRYGTIPNNELIQENSLISNVYYVHDILYSLIDDISSNSNSNEVATFSDISEPFFKDSSLIFPLFVAQKLLETPNINHFFKEVLHISNVRIPDLSQNIGLWSLTHMSISFAAANILGIELSLDNIISISSMSIKYATSIYFYQSTPVKLISLYSGEGIINNVLFNLELYKQNKPNIQPTKLGYLVAGITNFASFCYSIYKAPLKDKNIFEKFLFIQKFIQHAVLADYTIKTFVGAIEDEAYLSISEFNVND